MDVMCQDLFKIGHVDLEKNFSKFTHVFHHFFILSRIGFLIYLNKCKSPFLCKALCQVRMNYAERFYSKRSITKTRDDIIKQVISFQQKSYTLTKAIYSNLHVVESLPGKTCVACLLLFF